MTTKSFNENIDEKNEHMPSIISGHHWWLITKLFLQLYFLPTIHRWLVVEETLSFVVTIWN